MLLGFRKQYAPMIISGTKRQTIRRDRKDGQIPKNGETLYLYEGLRTKQCQKLGEAICTWTKSILIDWKNGIYIDSKKLTGGEVDKLAQADGFINRRDFIAFFERVHNTSRVPFSGNVIARDYFRRAENGSEKRQ